MSPDNLRVLRSEQSTGNLPGLRELPSQKNHLRHVSLLVAGKHDSGFLVKRWGNASSTEGTPEPLWSASASVEKDRRAKAVAMKRKSSVRGFEVQTADESGFWADEESYESDSVKEEDRPLEEHVRIFTSASRANRRNSPERFRRRTSRPPHSLLGGKTKGKGKERSSSQLEPG
ncbi:hypothetical protein BKA82DRAFT_21517 [Pisolithus tinctorius]|uniref:Uncharacterized protein n=1 Tax=Pisolithus tinctorius Marx 270 TaxID=870435 RepID=A0A0C3PM04_PISTI|nr:hypothetical protein BKA82DRAFT_21517 [Pisolithus tinctorius]KIO09806.1 hypothetical protein M404DRAFT_21517 [Pisolithus tinctorius Marx 270]